MGLFPIACDRTTYLHSVSTEQGEREGGRSRAAMQVEAFRFAQAHIPMITTRPVGRIEKRRG